MFIECILRGDKEKLQGSALVISPLLLPQKHWLSILHVQNSARSQMYEIPFEN